MIISFGQNEDCSWKNSIFEIIREDVVGQMKAVHAKINHMQVNYADYAE